MIEVALMALAVLLTSLGSGLRRVPPGYAGLVEREGSFRRRLRFRLGWVVPGVEQLLLVDLGTHQAALGPLPLRSRDALPLVAQVTFRYCVVDPVRATYRAHSVRSSVEHLARHELRMMMAGLPADAMLERSQALSHALSSHLERAEAAWGIRVDEVAAELRRYDTLEVGNLRG